MAKQDRAVSGQRDQALQRRLSPLEKDDDRPDAYRNQWVEIMHPHEGRAIVRRQAEGQSENDPNQQCGEAKKGGYLQFDWNRPTLSYTID